MRLRALHILLSLPMPETSYGIVSYLHFQTAFKHLIYRDNTILLSRYINYNQLHENIHYNSCFFSHYSTCVTQTKKGGSVLKIHFFQTT